MSIFSVLGLVRDACECREESFMDLEANGRVKHLKSLTSEGGTMNKKTPGCLGYIRG